MEKLPSGIEPESWLVPAGRAPESGAPLHRHSVTVSPIPLRSSANVYPANEF